MQYANLVYHPYPFILEPIYVHPLSFAYPHDAYIPSTRQYPPVDPTIFSKSAQSFEPLMVDAKRIVEKISVSTDFARDVMKAAQESDKKTVQRLIKSTGISSRSVIDYNPDGINIRLEADIGEVECCKLTMAIRWR
ncbi:MULTISPECIES: hypothetical protein [unclassified Virgibacillus]|uniref:hypothetical protein n=1 Tax=unclassified Virgibacillus TaxID=2620237 RepID=UPI0024DEE9EF|nr:hypothetical protein [Virgibacillus sp. LDC-1]